jgi:hypothetical protein
MSKTLDELASNLHTATLAEHGEMVASIAESCFRFGYAERGNEIEALKAKLVLAMEPIDEIADHGSFRGWCIDGSGFTDDLRKVLRERRSVIQKLNEVKDE